jgi:glycosyltransferase involved in cell wall biosynthesis
MDVSVVVPVRDEEGTIAALLDSLLAQIRRPEEIVTVDGGSRDRTVEIIEEYARKDPRIRLVRTTGAFPGEGRNLGVQASCHDVIAFTDAGIRLDSRWLEKLCEPMERDPSVDVVYGHLEPITDTFFTECAALAYVAAPTQHAGTWIRAPFIVSSIMKRAVWERVGGFPPFRASEDLIFMDTIEQGNFKIAYAPGAVVYWRIASDWTGTFRRFASYSRHNLLAGRARYWHYGVARLYGAAAVFFALAVVHSPLWAMVPFVGLIWRALNIAYRKREAFAFRDVFRPKRLLYLTGLLVLIDAATVWGFCLWVWKDRLR